jgi:hypothetical protein
LGEGCGGRFSVDDERHEGRTVKSRGPDASTLASSWRNRLSPTTVTREPDRRGERDDKPLKPFAQGVPDRFGGPVVTISCAFCFAREAVGAHVASGIPCALSIEGHRVFLKNPGEIRSAGRWSHVIARSESESNPELQFLLDFWIASLRSQ